MNDFCDFLMDEEGSIASTTCGDMDMAVVGLDLDDDEQPAEPSTWLVEIRPPSSQLPQPLPPLSPQPQPQPQPQPVGEFSALIHHPFRSEWKAEIVLSRDPCAAQPTDFDLWFRPNTASQVFVAKNLRPGFDFMNIPDTPGFLRTICMNQSFERAPTLENPSGSRHSAAYIEWNCDENPSHPYVRLDILQDVDLHRTKFVMRIASVVLWPVQRM